MENADFSESSALRTANAMGRNTSGPTEYGKMFIDFASTSHLPVIDIGAGLGAVAIGALDAGAVVIANDMSEAHLLAIADRCSADQRRRLILQVGKFPTQLSFAEGSISAVHAANLLNFLTGPEIEMAATAMFKWLAPGGKAFLISGTPYVATLRNFIPVYQARRARGRKWPGELHVLSDYSDHFTIRELPDFLHLLDDEVLAAAFTEAGFVIERAEMYLRSGLPPYLFLDGRENVGMVISKPQ